jgi:uncharacterized membrane protein YedE/YeeE
MGLLPSSPSKFSHNQDPFPPVTLTPEPQLDARQYPLLSGELAQMQVDFANFTPWASLGGGVTIGLAAAALLLLLGRTLGISGIFFGALTSTGSEFRWRATFLLGLFAAPSLLVIFFVPTPPHFESPLAQVALAGLLVGFGARLGSGCTSGHGICGLSRLSPRSVVATLVFMSAGFLTVFVMRHSFW